MADLFAKRIDTRENRIMRMRPSTCVDFIDAVRRALPRTSGNRWAHGFLSDVRQQLAGGYRATLTPAQTGHLLRTADHAGVALEDFGNEGMAKPGTDRPNGERKPKPCPPEMTRSAS